MKRNQKVTTEEVIAAVKEHGSQRAAARALGVNHKTVRVHLAKDFDIDALPDSERNIDEIVEHRKREFKRRNEYETAAALTPIKIRVPGPIAIFHIGDPHVDDAGTDLGLLEHHLQLVRDNHACFAANLGDMQNNWIGRLANLYSESTVTARESWKMVEWMINYLATPRGTKWLYLVGGNHDFWSGQRDPLTWLCRQAGAHLRYHGARFGLQFPKGDEIRINTRHDFRGSSQWNLAHAPMKAAQMGFRDHILTCGHRHSDGYGIVVHPDPAIATISHCIRVSSYKIHDSFAKQIGVLSSRIGPCAVTILDPESETEAGKVMVDWEPDRAVKFLKFLRTERGYDNGESKQ